MQIRNLLIAAGAVLAATTTIAAVPTAANAQGFYHPFHHSYRAERVREYRLFEGRRYWDRAPFEAPRYRRRVFYRY